MVVSLNKWIHFPMYYTIYNRYTAISKENNLSLLHTKEHEYIQPKYKPRLQLFPALPKMKNLKATGYVWKLVIWYKNNSFRLISCTYKTEKCMILGRTIFHRKYTNSQEHVMYDSLNICLKRSIKFRKFVEIWKSRSLMKTNLLLFILLIFFKK